MGRKEREKERVKEKGSGIKGVLAGLHEQRRLFLLLLLLGHGPDLLQYTLDNQGEDSLSFTPITLALSRLAFTEHLELRLELGYTG